MENKNMVMIVFLSMEKNIGLKFKCRYFCMGLNKCEIRYKGYVCFFGKNRLEKEKICVWMEKRCGLVEIENRVKKGNTGGGWLRDGKGCI
jgi:hypothetical protein